jgi:type II secretory pathway component PulJ
MRFKEDSRGITLIELIIAISLTVAILSSAYFFFFFAMKSMKDTQAEFDAEQDARMVMIYLEQDIRKAKAVNYAGVYHKAVEVTASGMGIDIYTDVDNDNALEIVKYKLENNQLKRGEAELGSSPANWSTIGHKVKNNMITPKVSIFSISDETVKINLILLDEEERLTDDPVSVATSITVRSKGAMD